jgi:hypothetical protein
MENREPASHQNGVNYDRTGTHVERYVNSHGAGYEPLAGRKQSNHQTTTAIGAQITGTAARISRAITAIGRYTNALGIIIAQIEQYFAKAEQSLTRNIGKIKGQDRDDWER